MRKYIKKHYAYLHAWLYLIMCNMNEYVYGLAIIFSLITPDVYHLLVLLLMVIAQFKPDWYNRNIVFFVGYIAFFILSKYISTLVDS